MKAMISFFLAILLVTASLCMATRPESSGPISYNKGTSRAGSQNNKGTGRTGNQNNKGGGNNAGMGGFFGPGTGFGIPGFGKGWGNGIIGGGYGAGYGGPNGGYARGGVIRPTVVCKEKGPCYMKKLTCPAKCFTSYSQAGKGYGGGGGGGGCTMDCKKKCIAYC